MGIVKNILSVLGIISTLILIFMFVKPKDTKELDDLHRQNDSLYNAILINDLKFDSLKLVNNKLDSQQIVLRKQLNSLGDKANKLKQQHEKYIQHLNSLSNNDITELFADKFTDIE